MGDHAVAIAKATIRIKGENRMTDIEAEIKKMGKAVRHMVEEALEVYLNADEKRAYEIAASDEIIDNFFRDIQSMTVEGVGKIQMQPSLLKNISSTHVFGTHW
ncbi:MAG: PhoU domain-containing protein [Streptococcus sp.]